MHISRAAPSISHPGCAAAEMVSGFLKSSSHNLRYIGIDSLARIVHINAKYAAEHQLAVIDCLEDPDDTLKKKTLELLYKMTKPSNVEVGQRSCKLPSVSLMTVDFITVQHSPGVLQQVSSSHSEQLLA